MNHPDHPPSPNTFRTIISYVSMLIFTVIAFLLIRNYGETLSAPVMAQLDGILAPAKPAGDTFLRVLIALTAIIITGQILAKLFAYLHQPPVIGEVVAGILLGPSLLGPEVSALVLPSSVAPFLGVIAQLGVVLYMFLVGLELNPSLLKHRAHATITTSHASIIFPFTLGALIALPLYPILSSSHVPFTSFALFMGVAMSITAFPVLARILTDYQMTRTKVGVIAISCAAVDDVTAWCLLAFVVGFVNSEMNTGLFVVGGALAFITFMFIAAKPSLAWATQHPYTQKNPRSLTILIFLALLVSALTAEFIGIHAIFGAFILGVLIPHDSTAAKSLSQQLEPVVTILFLPAFFAFTGMRTRIDLLAEPHLWMICGFIIVVATVGKFGGTFIAAKLTGLGWRDSAILGTLMNTRGLMELIVLNVGLDLGVISPTLFTMMVVMALVTTALTSPVLRLLNRSRIEIEEESHIANKV